MKGWGAKFRGEFRRMKINLTTVLAELDDLGYQGLLVEEDWKRRYEIKEQLSQLYAGDDWSKGIAE